MSIKKKLKYFFRSGSVDFVRASDYQAEIKVSSIDFHGKPVYFRTGTSDPHLVYSILLRKGRSAEYAFPARLQPKVILDIGANVGTSAVLFSELYPAARVFAFEPVPENFEILRKNSETRRQIQPYMIALADQDGEMTMMVSRSDRNFGGFSFYSRGCAVDQRFTVQTATPKLFLGSHSIDKVDLIKIDTEGAEYSILTAFDPAVLSEVTWITGELHGEKDFELLAYLSQWFDLELKKNFKNRLFNFRACNKKSIDLLL